MHPGMDPQQELVFGQVQEVAPGIDAEEMEPLLLLWQEA